MTFSKYMAILNSELYWAIHRHLHGIAQHVFFCSITPNINTGDAYIITALFTRHCIAKNARTKKTCNGGLVVTRRFACDN